MKRTALKRKTPMKAVSAKRQREGRIYSIKRRSFLLAHPTCQVQLDEEIKCLAQSVDIHHTRKRGEFYLDESTFMAVCRYHHEIIHRNPDWARVRGYLA